MKVLYKCALSFCFFVFSIVVAKWFLRVPEYLSKKESAIQYYVSKYESVKASNSNSNCKIAFGYTGCQDRKLKGLDYISVLNGSFIPKENPKIKTIQEFVETFAYFFQKGAATEYFIEDTETFAELLSLTQSPQLNYLTTFGGHAPHMALRASKENCEALLIAGIGKEEEDQIKSLDVNSKITFSRYIEDSHHSDIHLILEYDSQIYNNISAPRANRFYANHDVRSPNLSTLEHYHKVTKEMGITKHALAGFQLMQALGSENAIKRMSDVKYFWEKMREDEKNGPKNYIHVEFAAFANKDIYSYFVNNIAMKADSLGLNEQETQILHGYLTASQFSTIADSNPSIKQSLKKVFGIIDYVKAKKAQVSRIHAHGIGQQFLCYDQNIWDDGEDSLSAGVVTGFKQCCNKTEVEKELIRMAFEENEGLEELTKEAEFLERKNEQPIIRVQKGNWFCYIGYNMICNHLGSMAGLGDNISCAGFVYHKLKQSQTQ